MVSLMICVLCRELCPALDDYLLFGVELDGVTPLCVQIAEEAGLPPAEREVGDGGSDADVDADVACRSFVPEAACCCAAGGEERGSVAVFALADDADGLFQRVGVDEAEHGAEDFGGRKFACGRNPVNDGGSDEVARLVTRDSGTTAIVRNGGAISGALGDEAFDAGAAVGGDHGAHANAFVEAVAHLDGTGEVADGVTEPLLSFAYCDGDGDSKTTLSGAGESALADDGGCGVEVGVGQNDGVILGSALALYALAVGGSAGVDVLGDGRGADEADGADLGMVKDGVHGFASAVDKADDALGQVEALEQSECKLHGEWNFFRWLQEEAVAASDGVGEVPEGNHRREVEGSDGG